MNKSTSCNSLTVLISTLVLAIGASLALSLTVAASDTPLKGAERLTKISSVATPRPVASSPSTSKPAGHDTCCQTTFANKPIASSKGAEVLVAGGKPTSMVAEHGCGGCSTRIETSGHGKAKTSTAIHECTRATLASVKCCN